MRKLGIIGGMSWYSTRGYYETINKLVQARHGPRASAPLLIESLDYAPLARLSEAADWARAGEVLTDSARRLEAAGATALIIAANSMHKLYDAVAGAVGAPVLHIAECVAARMAGKVRRAALIGPRNVMFEDFYRCKLTERGIALFPADPRLADTVDRILYDELVVGRATRQAERALKSIITALAQAGAEAIVLGATELEMVVDVDANVLPVYACARIHAEAAVDWILG